MFGKGTLLVKVFVVEMHYWLSKFVVLVFDCLQPRNLCLLVVYIDLTMLVCLLCHDEAVFISVEKCRDMKHVSEKIAKISLLVILEWKKGMLEFLSRGKCWTSCCRIMVISGGNCNF